MYFVNFFLLVYGPRAYDLSKEVYIKWKKL